MLSGDCVVRACCGKTGVAGTSIRGWLLSFQRPPEAGHGASPWVTVPGNAPLDHAQSCCRGSSAGSKYSRPKGPMADTWVMYSPDFAQWKCQVSPGSTMT